MKDTLRTVAATAPMSAFVSTIKRVNVSRASTAAVLTAAVLARETFTRLMVETKADIGAVAATVRSVSFILLFSLVQCCVLQRCTPHHMIRANVQLLAKTMNYAVFRQFWSAACGTVIRKLR